MQKVFVCLFGFVSGVLAIVLIRFVADYMFGGRYAKPPVIHVEVWRQVDLLAYNEELVDDLNSWRIQSELVALAGLFVRLSGVLARKTDCQGGRPDRAGIWICWCTGHSVRMLTTLRDEAHGEAELVTIQRGVVRRFAGEVLVNEHDGS